MVSDKEKKQEEAIIKREPLGFARIFLKAVALLTSLYHL